MSRRIPLFELFLSAIEEKIENCKERYFGKDVLDEVVIPQIEDAETWRELWELKPIEALASALYTVTEDGDWNLDPDGFMCPPNEVWYLTDIYAYRTAGTYDVLYWAIDIPVAGARLRVPLNATASGARTYYDLEKPLTDPIRVEEGARVTGIEVYNWSVEGITKIYVYGKRFYIQEGIIS